MKHTFKSDIGVIVTVDVTPETVAQLGGRISRLDAIQLGGQALLLHAQELARPVDAEGEEVEPESQEILDKADDLGFDARTPGNLLEENNEELDEEEVLEKGYF